MEWQTIITMGLEWSSFDVYKTMTISFDVGGQDLSPEGVYSDNAVEMIGGSKAWDEFFGHYPVLMKDGREVVRLNPNDYSKSIDGQLVDIESGEAGDVMIAFPRKGLKISKNNDILTISFIDAPNHQHYQYYAHTHNGNLNTFYIGAYDGYIDENGKLRSLSGKMPTVEHTISEFRQSAQLNGEGYE